MSCIVLEQLGSPPGKHASSGIRQQEGQKRSVAHLKQSQPFFELQASLGAHPMLSGSTDGNMTGCKGPKMGPCESNESEWWPNHTSCPPPKDTPTSRAINAPHLLSGQWVQLMHAILMASSAS